MNVPIAKWAALHFDPPPSIRTVRGWARAGMIHPAPVKVGTRLYCHIDAQYRPHAPTTHDDDVVQGIWNGRKTA